MTSKEIEELAGHRQVPAWVVKLVSDAVAVEREECAKVCDGWPDYNVQGLAETIRARGNHG